MQGKVFGGMEGGVSEPHPQLKDQLFASTDDRKRDFVLQYSLFVVWYMADE